MSERKESVPFWLVAFVAGTATFVLVALAGLVLTRALRPAPAPPAKSPEQAALERALAEYVGHYGTMPATAGVGSAESRPAAPPGTPGAEPRPAPVSRPATAPPLSGADLRLIVETLEVQGADTADQRRIAARITVVNDGPETAVKVVVEVRGEPGAGTVAAPLALGDLPAGARRELITSVDPGSDAAVVFEARSSTPDPDPATNRVRIDVPPRARPRGRTERAGVAGNGV